MYDFVDVTDVQDNKTLPAEAMMINGVYIEDEIEGYRTLYTQGRESLSKEITTYETGIRDGAVFQNRRYSSREIVVGYQLIAPDPEAFRNAYNSLCSILDVEEAQLIFADEPDKYLTGTPSKIDKVDPGMDCVTGEFTILCADPFKYSLIEYEVEPSADSGSTFVVDYKGTYKAYPTLEATFYSESEAGKDGESTDGLTGNGDCGYVAFFNDNNKIILLGDSDEEDTAEYDAAQTLVYQDFKSLTEWTTALNANWIKNDGRVTAGFVEQNGTSGFALSDITGDYGYYLTATDYGSTNEEGSHGPTVTRQLPKDAAEEVGATDWRLSWTLKFNIGNDSDANKKYGDFQMCAYDHDDNDRYVAGVRIWKSAAGTTGKIRMYIMESVVKEVTNVDLSHNNLQFGTNSPSNGITTVKSCSITKSGSTVTFSLGGVTYSFTDSRVTDAKVTHFTMAFGQYMSKDVMPWIGVYSVKFVKNNCTTWANVPNKFSTDDVVVVNCRTGEITLNDSPAPELGALGNDYEEFYLSPGVNQIGTSYSDWVEDAYAPTFKLRYREVYL